MNQESGQAAPKRRTTTTIGVRITIGGGGGLIRGCLFGAWLLTLLVLVGRDTEASNRYETELA